MYNEEILQNRNKGWWRKLGKSLCALFSVSQTPGRLMLVMLANYHQKLWILPFFQHLRQTKFFFQFVGMEQEAEIELPLGALEQGRMRSLPDFGETGTETFININNPHAMHLLLYEIDGQQENSLVRLYILSLDFWIIYCFWVGILSRWEALTLGGYITPIRSSMHWHQ